MTKILIRTKRFIFCKNGEACYLKTNDEFKFILIGRTYIINVFGHEFTNK